MWKAFKIGAGKLIAWNEIIFCPQEATCHSEENCFSQSQRKRWIRRLRTMEESMMSVASSNIPIPRAQKNFLETLRSVTANHSPVKTVRSGVYDQLRIYWLQRLQRISLDSKRKSCLQFKLKPQPNREKGRSRTSS